MNSDFFVFILLVVEYNYKSLIANQLPYSIYSEVQRGKY